LGSLAICLPREIYWLRNLAGSGTRTNASSSWTRAVRERAPLSEDIQRQLVKVVKPTGGPVEAYEVWEVRHLPV
jgi:hypothetical protein